MSKKNHIRAVVLDDRIELQFKTPATNGEWLTDSTYWLQKHQFKEGLPEIEIVSAKIFLRLQEMQFNLNLDADFSVSIETDMFDECKH